MGMKTNKHNVRSHILGSLNRTVRRVRTHYGHERQNVLLQLLAVVGGHLGVCRHHHLYEVRLTGGAATPSAAGLLGCRQVRSEVNTARSPGHREVTFTD